MRSRVAFLVLGSIATVLANGCAASVQAVREAYADNRLLDARQLAVSFNPDKDPAGYKAVQPLLPQIERDRQVLIDLWLARAAACKDACALHAVESALALMTSTDVRYALVRDLAKTTRLGIEQRREAYVAEFKTLRARLTGCPGPEFDQSLRRLAVIRNALDQGDSLTATAVDTARACFAVGGYDRVVTLTRLAEDLALAGERLPVAAENRAFMAQARLPAATDSTKPPHEVKRDPRRTAVVAAPAPPPAEKALRNANQIFDTGDWHRALLELDAAVREFTDPQSVALLEAQMRSWQSTREELVASYLKDGEMALRQENPDRAYQWYQRILELVPDHAAAKDRLRKIETLRKLRRQDTGS